jgi:hypothetical protein
VSSAGGKNCRIPDDARRMIRASFVGQLIPISVHGNKGFYLSCEKRGCSSLLGGSVPYFVAQMLRKRRSNTIALEFLCPKRKIMANITSKIAQIWTTVTKIQAYYREKLH